MNKFKIKIIILIIVLLCFILPMTIFLFQQIVGNSKIKFLTAPSEVYISIDNKDKKLIKTGDIITLKAGNHNIKVTKDNFESYTKKVTTKNNKTITFTVILTGLTDNAKKTVRNDTTDQILEIWSGQQADEYTQTIGEKYPISKILPISNNWYTVTLCDSEKYPDDKNKQAVCITTHKDGAENIATSYIQSEGYKLSDYEVIWSQAYNAD